MVVILDTASSMIEIREQARMDGRRHLIIRSSDRDLLEVVYQLIGRLGVVEVYSGNRDPLAPDEDMARLQDWRMTDKYEEISIPQPPRPGWYAFWIRDRD